jgi:hypothetical protein
VAGTWTHRVPANLAEEAELVRRTVNQMLAMTNAHDPAVCTRLFTQEHMERVSGLKGAAAVANCRRSIAGTKEKRNFTSLVSLRIDRLKPRDGVSKDQAARLSRIRLATVDFVTSVGKKRSRHRLQLVREPGGYRVSAMLPG